MSGKFVSAGTLDKPTERDDEWLRAEAELEAKRKEHEDRKPEHDGKTLFEVLQANKAAKEDAFQESIKLKNQFRALNDDEADFLEAQADAARAKENAVRKETLAELERFRQKQDSSIKMSDESTDINDQAANDANMDWTTSKKRKRIKEKESAIKGVKARRTSSDVNTVGAAQEPTNAISDVPLTEDEVRKVSSGKEPSVPKKSGLSLVAYDSDEDDE